MRLRLVLVLVGVVAVVLAAHDIPLANHLERVERDRLNTSLERDAFLLGMRAEEALERADADEDTELRALVLRYSDEEDVRVVIVDADANAVVASDDDEIENPDFSNRQEIVDALDDGAPQTGRRFSNTLGEDLFYVAVPVLSGDERVGAVRLTAPDRVVAERVDDRVRGILLVALISLLITVVVALVFARTVTRPLTRLRTATERFAGGDLAMRADESDGPPEVKSLARSFNSMAGRIEQLVQRQRAFAGTASHQLRTPLTALRLRLEQLDDELADEEPESSSVDAAIAETDRLHRMIEGLLALSRAEDATAVPEPTDLAAVVHDRVDHWTPLAHEREVDLVAEVPADLVVTALPGAVEQVIDNLVDNALEVSPPRSRLEVSVRDDGDVAELHVVDEGPGMSPDERAHAFERFWRGEHSADDGSGLGLPIVHQLVVAGGGDAELREAGSGGVDAVVRFRRRQPGDPERPPRRARSSHD